MAGLFDALQFDPSSYGGQRRGLLDLLAQAQFQPTPGQFPPTQGQGQPQPAAEQDASPMMIGNYSMPRIGPQALYEPTGGEERPQNSMPAQGQLPQAQTAPQPQGMNFGGNLMAGLNNLNSGGNPITALANVVTGFATGQRFDKAGIAQQQANMTTQALVKGGLSPELAHTVASNPDLLKAVLPQVLGMGGQTDDIKEYMFAKREDPTLTFDRFMARKRSVTGEHGLNIVYGEDGNGNTVAMQPSKSGGLVQANLPQGVRLTPGVKEMDLGTQIGLYDVKTGQFVGFKPKDLKGAAAATAEGKDLGDAAAQYENMASKMPGLNTVVKRLDDLAKRATYTTGGRLFDEVGRQIGAAPRDAAVARAEYISIVDNQILPLLRDTFGAAFTQKEGETLRATLGDPNASPQEKHAKLNAFIEQKQRDIEALAKRTGRAAPAAATQVSPAGAVRKYNPATGRIE